MKIRSRRFSPFRKALTILSHLCRHSCQRSFVSHRRRRSRRDHFSLIDGERRSDRASSAAQPCHSAFCKSRAGTFGGTQTACARPVAESDSPSAPIRNSRRCGDLPCARHGTFMKARSSFCKALRLYQSRARKIHPSCHSPSSATTLCRLLFMVPKASRSYVYARTASPKRKHQEMGAFVGVPIGHAARFVRHASECFRCSSSRLQADDELAVRGTLRRALRLPRCFPNRHLFVVDSTHFRTDPKSGKVTASESLTALQHCSKE